VGCIFNSAGLIFTREIACITIISSVLVHISINLVSLVYVDSDNKVLDDDSCDGLRLSINELVVFVFKYSNNIYLSFFFLLMCTFIYFVNKLK
jgi:hypothetical protein